jgi:hypothetical protein
MSLLKHLENEAEHLLDLVKHMMAIQLNGHGVVSEATQKIHDALHAHVSETAEASAPVAPVVADSQPAVANPATVTDSTVQPAAPAVDAPQTAAQAQSASNVAN